MGIFLRCGVSPSPALCSPGAEGILWALSAEPWIEQRGRSCKGPFPLLSRSRGCMMGWGWRDAEVLLFFRCRASGGRSNGCIQQGSEPGTTTVQGWDAWIRRGFFFFLFATKLQTCKSPFNAYDRYKGVAQRKALGVCVCFGGAPCVRSCNPRAKIVSVKRQIQKRCPSAPLLCPFPAP
ncbi:hypothetical protein M440DRAFT_1217632 [Trichoderma longibrachiatum ATCC 18648]|uniref:Uncharacterized protein n=1 Tax=Trichoderma longibrachiatum ATCC 18648 TaxID=983965 RepID=A0A2T4C7X6_TRILO|nr:hypothetical protein M440DRAFT_1217632 [Trichoderma longibrachiatum ATCC 18648]